MGAGTLELHELQTRDSALEEILMGRGPSSTHNILVALEQNGVPLGVLSRKQYQDATKNGSVRMRKVYTDGMAMVQEKETEEKGIIHEYFLIEKEFRFFYILDPQHTYS